MRRSRIYLDWNATTPPLASVVASITRALEEGWGNSASVHREGRRARRMVDDARQALAAVVECHPRDVLFTASATEANNLALASAVGGVVLTRLEHPSVVGAAERAARRGLDVRFLPVSSTGEVIPDHFRSALAEMPPGTMMVVTAANHETGVIQPLASLSEVAEQWGAHLHVDAVQFLGRLSSSEVDWERFSSVSFSAHKIRGPRGVGGLIWRRAPALLRPLLLGGGQERGLRAGTVNAAALAGLPEALAWVQDSKGRQAHLRSLRDRFEAALGDVGTIHGEHAPRLAHVSNISFPDCRGDEIVAALDLLGVAVSSGSACSAGSAEPSPVIAAMAGEELARGAVRLSLGDVTTESEMEQAITAFKRVLSQQSSSA